MINNTSVIIPTYNGANKIINLLHSLENQTCKNFETIVVIDGSTDNTFETLTSNKFNLQSLKIIEQMNKGRGVVRNKGAEAASGVLLIFFDDDMILNENCIQKHIEHHQKYGSTILTGGIGEDITKAKTDIQAYKAYLSAKWCMPLKGLNENPLSKENIFITAQNFSISLNLFIELEGFDKNLNDAEDYDLAVRAFDKDILLYYNHEAFAWHNDLITFQAYIRRQREYVVMLNKLKTLKPELYTKYQLREIKYPVGIKSILFKLLTFKSLIWFVDHFNIFRIFPKKFRYKIYEMIIYSNGVLFPNRVKL
jgi:glycosyltransferase involved in cell wall biosynthesis